MLPQNVNLCLILCLDTTLVSWDEQQYRMGDIVIENYIVTYQLRNIHCTCGYTTVNTSLTSVTLADLLPNSEYSVSVAAINTNGDLGASSGRIHFPTDTAKKGEIPWTRCLIMYKFSACTCTRECTHTHPCMHA